MRRRITGSSDTDRARGGPSITIDGKSADWASVPVYAASGGYSLKLLADEGWLHLGLFWAAGTKPPPGGFLVGLDTHDAARGDHKLPFGLKGTSEAGLEFVALFQGDKAAVFADEPYDLFSNRERKLYRSVDNRAGRFVMPKTESNRWRVGRDGTIFPSKQQEIGWLKEGTQDRSSPAFDSMAEWERGSGFIEARIPWGLLNVSDPSSRAIVSAPEGLPRSSEGAPVTDGFRLVLVAYKGDAFAGKASILATMPAASASGAIGMPPLFSWKTWEESTWHSFRKQAYDIYAAALAGIPDEPAPR